MVTSRVLSVTMRNAPSPEAVEAAYTRRLPSGLKSGLNSASFEFVICTGGLGVCVVPRKRASDVLKASQAREAKEAQVRERLKAGELGLDIYGMREKLAQRGLIYLEQPPEG